VRSQGSNELFDFIILSCLSQVLDQLLNVVVVVIWRVDFLYFLLSKRQLIILLGDLFPFIVTVGFGEAFVNLSDFGFGGDIFVNFLIVIFHNLFHSYVRVDDFLFECVKQVFEWVDEKVH
jgi:hypothetical protein